MTIVRRLGVLSVGKMTGGLYLLFGLLIGAIMALFSLFGGLASLASEDPTGGFLASMFFGVGAVVFLPLFYGVLGFLGGLLTAFIYNVVASLFGGIELDLVERGGAWRGSVGGTTGTGSTGSGGGAADPPPASRGI